MKTTLYLIVPIFGILFFILSGSSPNRALEKTWYKGINEKYTYVPFEKGGFLMLKTEIDNESYQLFLEELRISGDAEKYRIAQVDSSGWRTKSAYGEPYASYYHSHPAYRNYPVVNVTREGAELYCEWLTAKLKEADGGKSGLVFRLPTHDEWVYAAMGGLQLNTYAWGGPYLRNSKGCYLCNFAALGAENISRDSTGTWTVLGHAPWVGEGDHADVTAPVNSYFPNGYGLHNMNGNVAEMVSDKELVAGGSWNDPGYDVRNESVRPYTGSSKTIGFRIVASAEPQSLEWFKIPRNR